MDYVLILIGIIMIIAGVFVFYIGYRRSVAGFLSAISIFSGSVLKAGSTFSIRSKQLFFIMTQIEGNIFALQSLHTNKNLESNFFEFGKKINPKIQFYTEPKDVDQKIIEKDIHDFFSQFY